MWNSLGTYEFLCKNQIKNDEIVRYKAQLVGQGCSQNLVLICEKTYSLVLDATTLQYSIILVAQQDLHLYLMDDVITYSLHLYLMDDVITYSYGSFENHIYMKIPQGFYLPNKTNSKEGYSIKLNMLFYWLKQSGHVWHNRLIEYLLKEGYRNDLICSCIYMKRSKNEFAIIIVYVEDKNIVGTPNELTKAIDYSKK